MAKTQTIFVVDDESTLRDVVRRYLELDGFQVIEAETGLQALDVLRERPVDRFCSTSCFQNWMASV
jgi:DNA-binding response OmpR family regulator